MNLAQALAVVLSCIFFTQQTAASAGWSNVENSGLLQSQSSATTSSTQTSQSRNQAAQDERFQQRRQHFNSGRQLLLEKGVPFDPDELLHDRWSKELHNALNSMPEMHQVRYENAPLNGAYLADTLYLPEKVELIGHTLILANYLVFEGKNPVIKGAFDLNVFPRQPIAVLGTSVAQALHEKAGVLNVRFGNKTVLPSFALAKDVRKGWTHITLDTSGPEPKIAPRTPRVRPAEMHATSWNGLLPVGFLQQECSTGCNLSGNTGSGGSNGTPGAPGTAGDSPVKSPSGSCGGSINGQGGASGGDGAPGQNGGMGGQGGPGFNARDINVNIPDGDLNEYSFIADGGTGGQGGAGGTGGMGGNGGRGGDGGDGVACSCQLVGDGGDAGHGGNGGAAGNGANGGVGGQGGTGGAINVSLPANSPGAISSNHGGLGGRGGDGGIGGIGGSGGPAGTPGNGATACGITGANGGITFGGSPGLSGSPGIPGSFGSAGLNGPPPNITFRSQNTFVDPITCLGSSDPSTSIEPNGVAPVCSPIIVDTTGEGFHLTSAADGVNFDIAGDGHPIQIAWTASGSGNGFLALDRNHNGVIDNGIELFGNFTQQPKSATPNGFLALAEFDKPENGGNGDGIIDQHDAVFQHLVIWIDANHDGISQPSELHPLPELGIYSLSLNYTDSRRVDQFGNVFRFRAKINPSGNDNGSETGRWAFDVFLTTTTK